MKILSINYLLSTKEYFGGSLIKGTLGLYINPPNRRSFLTLSCDEDCHKKLQEEIETFLETPIELEVELGIDDIDWEGLKEKVKQAFERHLRGIHEIC